MRLGLSNNRAGLHKELGFLVSLLFLVTNVYAQENCAIVKAFVLPNSEIIWVKDIEIGYQQDENGLIVIPAYGYDTSIYGLNEDTEWTKDNGWLQLLPDVGQNYGKTLEGPMLVYKINVIKNGEHYLWILGGGTGSASDSVSYSLGQERLGSITFLGKTWSNDLQYKDTRAVLQLTSGEHTLHIYAREDGVRFKEIRITNNPNYRP